MKSSTRDQTEGAFHEAKGAVRKFAGKLSDNPKQQAEGAVENAAGKIQKKIGQIKLVLGQ